MITAETQLELYLKVWDEIVLHKKLELFDEYFTPDYVFRTATENIEGPEAAKAYFGALMDAFSDREFVVQDAFEAGDRLAKHWVFRGTHTAEFAGIPATGKRIELKGVSLVRMSGGKIKEERDFMDDLGLLQQLGVIPPLG